MMWPHRAKLKRMARAHPRLAMRVVAPHFVGVLLFEKGLCTEAPESLDTAIGRPLDDLVRYAARRGWDTEFSQ